VALCLLAGDRLSDYPKNDDRYTDWSVSVVSSSILSNIDSVVAGRNVHTQAVLPASAVDLVTVIVTPQNGRVAVCGACLRVKRLIRTDARCRRRLRVWRVKRFRSKRGLRGCDPHAGR